MAEKRIVFSPTKIKYSGLFNITEIHKFIMNWFKKNDFDMVEELTCEQIFEKEKQITYEYKPYKKFTDFAKTYIYLKFNFDNVQDVTIELEGIKKKMHKGSLSIEVKGLLETDYENKWETKPFYYFLKVVFEKFILGSHEDYYQKYTKKKCELFVEETKALLNLQRLKV
jgi:hypothetical protein